jgi:hypothetical protein
LKDLSDIAVAGSAVSSGSGTIDFQTDITVSFFSTELLKGLATSFATLKTTSNFEASSRLGSM